MEYTPETLRALADIFEGHVRLRKITVDGVRFYDYLRAHADAWQEQVREAHEALANELCDCGMRDDHQRSLHAHSCVWAEWLDRHEEGVK